MKDWKRHTSASGVISEFELGESCSNSHRFNALSTMGGVEAGLGLSEPSFDGVLWVPTSLVMASTFFSGNHHREFKISDPETEQTRIVKKKDKWFNLEQGVSELLV